MQMIRKRMVQSAKECIKQRATNSEIYGKMQEVFIEMDRTPTVSSISAHDFLHLRKYA